MPRPSSGKAHNEASISAVAGFPAPAESRLRTEPSKNVLCGAPARREYRQKLDSVSHFCLAFCETLDKC
jgi:hypothetical protein